jgi:arsenite methyltransferase
MRRNGSKSRPGGLDNFDECRNSGDSKYFDDCRTNGPKEPIMIEPASTDIKTAVRKRYAGHATAQSSCCGAPVSDSRPAASCGCASSSPSTSEALGYDAAELAAIPEGADLGLGCGNPLGMFELREGETVLDLGSGGGIDCFLAARRVGPTGHVIGVDMTPEMIERARQIGRAHV